MRRYPAAAAWGQGWLDMDDEGGVPDGEDRSDDVELLTDGGVVGNVECDCGQVYHPDELDELGVDPVEYLCPDCGRTVDV